jgi:8-oxo-dGTP pyrophosphatase MutT (NUDIX family)
MTYLKKLNVWMLKKLHKLPPITEANQPCYDKYGRFLGWFSRSVAAAIFVYCKDQDGDWCVLASERGEEAADYRGFWNCCCGYLDRNETVKSCALRELYEETGVFIDDEDIVKFIGYEDSPEVNRQNVTFRFAAFIDDAITDDFKFSKKNNEGKEVGEIKWIKITEIDNYLWAFNHDKRIIEIFETNKRLSQLNDNR